MSKNSFKNSYTFELLNIKNWPYVLTKMYKNYQGIQLFLSSSVAVSLLLQVMPFIAVWQVNEPHLVKELQSERARR
jgi:hypothetical protein